MVPAEGAIVALGPTRLLADDRHDLAKVNAAIESFRIKMPGSQVRQFSPR
jgi:hypothetical protein